LAGLAGLERTYRDILELYGNDFRRPYGWAHPAIQNRIPSLTGGERIGFEHLQAAVQFDSWSRWYRMASHAVHPSATFLQFNVIQDDVLVAGRSDVGLSDPAQGGVISLLLASAALLAYRPDNNEKSVDYLKADIRLTAMVYALRDLTDLTIETFAKAYDALEKEINA